MNRVLARIAVLCLAVALVSQPAFSAGSLVTRAGKEPGFFAAARQFLLTLIPSSGQAHGTMDPTGNTPSGPNSNAGTPPIPPTEPNAHGTMDPDGAS